MSLYNSFQNPTNRSVCDSTILLNSSISTKFIMLLQNRNYSKNIIAFLINVEFVSHRCIDKISFCYLSDCNSYINIKIINASVSIFAEMSYNLQLPGAKNVIYTHLNED